MASSSSTRLMSCVFNLATGRSQTVPHGQEFAGYHVLLVGDGEGGDVGRPFRVVKANLVLGNTNIRSRLQVQIFSSELGMWSRCTQIQTPQICGNSSHPLRGRSLVVGGAVHWLCLTNSAGYVLKLRVRAGERAGDGYTISWRRWKPAEGGRPCWWRTERRYLLGHSRRDANGMSSRRWSSSTRRSHGYWAVWARGGCSHGCGGGSKLT
ncbi:hypothetical protein GQ55_2G465700 [Panicum hallii var. hallii]|uniref:Uncharacterized protein n=1 Tax=Panicum hallii var. hallii TaxID=1504633 RepID=A0A2T7EZS6_9POAL|nr:hypothetical protein GQ55_2G465700 [Panicum hallii var. hallii]